MTNFLTIILSLSLAATLLFGAIRCLNKFGFPIEGIYRLEKLVSLFYLLPAIFIVSVFGQICLTDIRTLSLYTEDFSYVSQFGDSWKLSLLKYDTVLQNINRISYSNWLIGFIIFFAVDLLRSTIILNDILKQCQPIEEGFQWECMNAIKQRININGNIYLYQSNKYITRYYPIGFHKIRLSIRPLNITPV